MSLSGASHVELVDRRYAETGYSDHDLELQVVDDDGFCGIHREESQRCKIDGRCLAFLTEAVVVDQFLSPWSLIITVSPGLRSDRECTWWFLSK